MKSKQILLTIIFLFSAVQIDGQNKLYFDLNNFELDSLLTLKLPTDTNDTNKEFSKNFNDGISFLKESISLADGESYHSIEEAEENQALIINRAEKSKLFLEKAHQINGRDKNTIIGLYIVARLLFDIPGCDKYVKLYESLD